MRRPAILRLCLGLAGITLWCASAGAQGTSKSLTVGGDGIQSTFEDAFSEFKEEKAAGTGKVAWMSQTLTDQDLDTATSAENTLILTSIVAGGVVIDKFMIGGAVGYVVVDGDVDSFPAGVLTGRTKFDSTGPTIAGYFGYLFSDRFYTDLLYYHGFLKNENENTNAGGGALTTAEYDSAIDSMVLAFNYTDTKGKLNFG